MKRALAFDFGASSGRAVIGEFDGEKITLSEVHRFTNDPVMVNGTFYWDILRLFHEIKQGIIKAKLSGGFDSIGIDTWGVDFGFIDKNGNLLENPVHYRDKRNEGMIEEAEKYISKEEMYSRTGIQFMDFNTIFQLLSVKRNRPELLKKADKALFMPDLMGFLLTGNRTAEYSIATTSQGVNTQTKNWDDEIFSSLGIPKSIMCDIKPSGSILGMLKSDICEELGVNSVPVISVCGHDTQSAVTAVPTQKDDFAFISSGTWSLFGTELEKPIINEKTEKFNITNEGGYGDTTAFLKNICGLWLIQESRRQWKREGKDYSYADLEREALGAEPFKCFIDPDSPEFSPMGDMPKRVSDFCKRTGQHVPETVGEIMRCIYESLALKYRNIFCGIESCTEKTYDCIHVVGGGTKDGLLCRMTASSCNTKVLAGPVEATVLGNIAVQLISQNEIKDIKHARQIIANGEIIKEYEPEEPEKWEKAYNRFIKLI